MVKKIKRKKEKERRKKNLLNKTLIEILKKKFKVIKEDTKKGVTKKRFKEVEETNQIIHKSSATNLEESLKEFKSPVLEKIATEVKIDSSESFSSSFQEEKKEKINYETESIHYSSSYKVKMVSAEYPSIMEHPNIAKTSINDEKTFLKKQHIVGDEVFLKRELNDKMWANKTNAERDIKDLYLKKKELYSNEIRSDEKKEDRKYD